MDIIHNPPFYELTALLALAASIGFLGLLLRQPMIVSFIVVGVLSGPSGLDIVKSHENIDLLSELGITLLLFLVGLKLDIKLIRTLGPVALATGLGQVAFTSIIGFFIGISLGMDTITSIYVSIALTFSSTIIIVKLLSDKKEAESLYGRIAIGFLIVQDLVVVITMIALSAFGVGADIESQNSALEQIIYVLTYGLIVLSMVGIFIRYIANPLISKIANSYELLIIFAIGWAVFLATLGNNFGFSKELGGLLAGVSLASTPFREALIARLSSLRDFLLLFFFIALGAKINIDIIGIQLIPSLIFSLFVLIGNPIIVMIIMGYMGYRKRTGFLAGLTVAQISEFSLIFIAMGMSLGHITEEYLGLVTLVGLITIATSVYMITYSHIIYNKLEPLLDIFERRVPIKEKAENYKQIARKRYDIIIFGIGRYGMAIAELLIKDGFRVLAVDFNPAHVNHWKKLGYDAMYGDACDQEFIGGLPMHHIKWIISAMPEYDFGLTHEDPRLVLIETLKHHRYSGKIAISTQHKKEIEHLKNKGADIVFLPFYDAASQAVEKLKNEF